MEKLAGKIALITGGNSGIGLASAKLFKKEGATVIITASSAESLKRAQAEIGTEFDVVQANISQVREIESLITHVKQKYGHLDVLFANAGTSEPMPTDVATEESFDRQFNVNTKGLYFTVAKALPLLKPGSAILLTSSAVAAKGYANSSIYAATKAAVRSFARTWANEFSERGIRVNVLSPGPIASPLWTKNGFKREYLVKAGQSIPIGRAGQPEEMAAVALFLASADSSYLTGADIMADGGSAQV